MARRNRTEIEDGDGGSGGEAAIGHNSALNAKDRAKLAGFVQEIEYHEEQKRTLMSDLADIYKTAKQQGFDTKAIRHIVKLRRMEREERDAFQNAVDTYRAALGDFASTPLGEAGMPQQKRA